MADDLGDRMKSYEARETERRFLPMLPVYARLDGRGFSQFTAGMARPYDVNMMCAMIGTTSALVEKTHAAIGYTQSDEISLVWLAEDYKSSIFFDYKIMKLASVLAALCTAVFARQIPDEWAERMPHFDCRVLQLPNRTEAANMFLWREHDAAKNAVSMAASAYYSHRELDHKTGPQKQEMLFAKGINFNDYPGCFKRGTFLRRRNVERLLTHYEWEAIPQKHRPSCDQPVIRSEIERMDMPRFGSVTNREAVIFDGAAPAVAE